MCRMDSMRSSCRQNEGRNLIDMLKQTTRFKLRKIIEQVDEALMMPMMLAQEASIIDIIGVPLLLPKPSGAVLVFQAVLASAPREAGAARSRVLMMLSRRAAWKTQNPSLFPCESARFWQAAPAPFLLRSRPSMALSPGGPPEGRAALPDALPPAVIGVGGMPQSSIFGMGNRSDHQCFGVWGFGLWGPQKCRKSRAATPQPSVLTGRKETWRRLGGEEKGKGGEGERPGAGWLN